MVTYGDEEAQFPAFFTRDSGLRAPYNLQRTEEIADMIGENCNTVIQSKKTYVLTYIVLFEIPFMTIIFLYLIILTLSHICGHVISSSYN